MARFFEASLDELVNRHSDIDSRFRRIDANNFTVIIYRGGEAKSRCRIQHGTR